MISPHPGAWEACHRCVALLRFPREACVVVGWFPRGLGDKNESGLAEREREAVPGKALSPGP